MTRLAAGPRNLTKHRLVVLFVAYLVLLTWLVLWKLDVPFVGGVQRVIKLVPFAPGAGAGASAPVEAFANLLLFVPFGVYLGLLVPSWAWWKAAGAVAGASLFLEVTQYVLAIGRSDITDVIANAAGGLAGFGLLALARRSLRARTVMVMTRICSIGTVLALLASGMLVAAQLRYAPPQDLPVVVSGPPPGSSSRPRSSPRSRRAAVPERPLGDSAGPPRCERR